MAYQSSGTSNKARKSKPSPMIKKTDKTAEEAKLEENARKLQQINDAHPEKRHWAGFTQAEASLKYSELYALGHFLKSNYYVKFAPYNDNLNSLPLFFDELSTYLVTQTNIPIIDAEFEDNKVGAYYTAALSGMRVPDIQLIILETNDARILNSLMMIRDAIANPDGTFNPPASYALEITMGLFSKDYGYEMTSVEQNFLVAPTQASLDALNARGFSEILDIPITFKVLKPYQWK